MPTATAQIFDGPGQPLHRETLPLPQSLQPGEVLVAIDLASFLLAGVAVMFIRMPGGETVAQKAVEPLYRAIAEGLA